MFFTFAARAQRVCAKGRSMLTVTISTSRERGSFSESSWVCASHVGVSSDGTTLMMRTLPVGSAMFTGARFPPVSVEAGSGWPTLIGLPAKRQGACP